MARSKHPDEVWNDLVTEGRQLDKREGNLRWEWGDWALKAAPIGANGTNTGRYERLQMLMEDAGITSVAFDTVINYTKVAAAWPASHRRLAASWSVHETLAHHSDRFRLIRDDMTKREAQTAAGRKVSGDGFQPKTADERAEKVREYLKDPEVVKEIAKDPHASGALHVASAKVGDINREEMVTQQRKSGTLAMSAFYQASSQLHGAAHRVRMALKLLREVSMTDEDTRESILADLNQITVACDWVESYVRSGNRSFEDELAALLADPPKDAA
jgi:hypothetical protein